MSNFKDIFYLVILISEKFSLHYYFFKSLKRNISDIKMRKLTIKLKRNTKK